MALQTLAHHLPNDFAAAILVVVHLAPASGGYLPDILNHTGHMPARNAVAGEEIRPGHIYIAPPDKHLLVTEKGRVQLGYGPRENGFRPAVDPLFRSAALVYGPRVIGIVLSGALDDGTAGLCAIQRLGGLTMVQDPLEAETPSMPETARRHVHTDFVLRMKDMAAKLPALVRENTETPAKGAVAMPDDMKVEVEVAANERPHPGILGLGTPSLFTCPECNGSLLRIRDAVPFRFRCHTGHAFTAAALEDELREKVEMAGWSAVRALQEHAMLLQELMQQPDVSSEQAADFQSKAEDALNRASLVREAIAKPETESD